MKNFLEKNTVSYNLMSFSGYKSLLIFSLLVAGPTTYADIQRAIFEDQYLKEVVTIDTIRIYLKTMTAFGCNIVKIVKKGTTYFYIDSHPFDLKIYPTQAKNLIKLYKAICKSIDLFDLIALNKLFEKITPYISGDEKLQRRLINISPTSKIDDQLIQDLIASIENNTEITISYNSPASGNKNINVVPDKIIVLDSKLYLCGYNKERNNYSRFLVRRIAEIINVKTKNPQDDVEFITVGYELIGDNIELLDNEKIIKQTGPDKFLIEITSKNRFDILQRILYLSQISKVIYPESFKLELLEYLNRMRNLYIDK